MASIRTSFGYVEGYLGVASLSYPWGSKSPNVHPIGALQASKQVLFHTWSPGVYVVHASSQLWLQFGGCTYGRLGQG